MMKPTIQEVLPLFEAYYSTHGPEWEGDLHPVLADGNVEDRHVKYATERAIKRGDVNTYVLGLILMQMSKTQRRKLPSMVKGTLAQDPLESVTKLGKRGILP